MPTSKTVAFAADHRGFPLKELLVAKARELGHQVIDLGTSSEDRCDSIDYAIKMARAFSGDAPPALGVLICGTGNGIAMVANRYASIIAAVVHDATTARMAREHNNANVMALGAHIIGKEVAFDCLETFLNTEFLGGRYAVRETRLRGLGGL
ncbi:MAG: RpiB/LacA/LacB family sugar-phosphate isomerase [Alphaproteobacteria bacterium]